MRTFCFILQRRQSVAQAWKVPHTRNLQGNLIAPTELKVASADVKMSSPDVPRTQCDASIDVKCESVVLFVCFSLRLLHIGPLLFSQVAAVWSPDLRGLLQSQYETFQWEQYSQQPRFQMGKRSPATDHLWDSTLNTRFDIYAKFGHPKRV